MKDASSDAEGRFTFDAGAGRYQIEVSAPGFSTRATDPMFVAGGARVSLMWRCRSARSRRASR